MDKEETNNTGENRKTIKMNEPTNEKYKYVCPYIYNPIYIYIYILPINKMGKEETNNHWEISKTIKVTKGTKK